MRVCKNCGNRGILSTIGADEDHSDASATMNCKECGTKVTCNGESVEGAIREIERLWDKLN